MVTAWYINSCSESRAKIWVFSYLLLATSHTDIDCWIFEHHISRHHDVWMRRAERSKSVHFVRFTCNSRWILGFAVNGQRFKEFGMVGGWKDIHGNFDIVYKGSANIGTVFSGLADPEFWRKMTFLCMENMSARRLLFFHLRFREGACLGRLSSFAGEVETEKKNAWISIFGLERGDGLQVIIQFCWS